MKWPVMPLSYPVGENIVAANSFAENAANVFMTLHENVCVNVWCMGSSGAILAALFASKINAVNIKIVHVKKSGENSHGTTSPLYSTKSTGGIFNGSAIVNVVIDDFISSGRTMARIYEEMVLYHIYIPDVLIVKRAGQRAMQNIPFKPNVIISCD